MRCRLCWAWVCACRGYCHSFGVPGLGLRALWFLSFRFLSFRFVCSWGLCAATDRVKPCLHTVWLQVTIAGSLHATPDDGITAIRITAWTHARTRLKHPHPKVLEPQALNPAPYIPKPYIHTSLNPTSLNPTFLNP